MQVWDCGAQLLAWFPYRENSSFTAGEVLAQDCRGSTGFVFILCPEVSLGQSEAVRGQVGNKQGPVEGAR